MWIAFAFGSALFAGLTAILAKCGIKNTDSNVATALRTIIVLIFSWIMVFVVGAQKGLADISGKTLLFLSFSGLSTGASWLCYFKALQLGDVNKVTPIDKSSTILTMLLAFILLREALSPLKVAAMIAIGVGTYLMIQKKETEEKKQDGKWLIYAIGSAVFASLTSILGKVGIQDVNSNLGTAIRTIVVLIMAWVVVFVTGKQHTLKQIDKSSLISVCSVRRKRDLRNFPDGSRLRFHSRTRILSHPRHIRFLYYLTFRFNIISPLISGYRSLIFLRHNRNL